MSRRSRKKVTGSTGSVVSETSGDDEPEARLPTAQQSAPAQQSALRKIKRSRPLLIVSCVLLLIWYVVLVFLAWAA